MANRKRCGQPVEPKPVTPFGTFVAWMGRKPRWPKSIGVLVLFVALAFARSSVMTGYFTAVDKIVGGNAPMAVVLGWLPGGGAIVLLGVYVLYAPFLGYRGKAVWTVVNVVWLAFGLMASFGRVPPQAHPAFDYGLDASQAAVPGLLVLGPLLLIVVLLLVGIAGWFSKRAKAKLGRKRSNEEQEQLTGWGLIAASLLFLAIALLSALT
ncbi:hypothetical protein [Allokutzneria sp. NRRL B-24872]|uniref:hypothetical protein n=1 Tax=Allokutzneria sp. NRRL B-24872 TaxID=1137961 RepID=UPI000A3B1354|nr:hypothetical protein [Allokutzneria sp. NRRL B-24872]